MIMVVMIGIIIIVPDFCLLGVTVPIDMALDINN